MKALPIFVRTLALVTGCLVLAGTIESCSKKDSTAAQTCINPSTPMQSSQAGSSGKAQIFNPDPATSSGQKNIAPNSVLLDQYAQNASLAHLNGNGVLAGQYVDVRNGLTCNSSYGAFDVSNNFQYSHQSTHFAEAMAYYWGDSYRAALDSLPGSLLQPKGSVEMITHCMQDDNAYFVRTEDDHHTVTAQYVCLGDSVVKPGATFADDATVPVHELEHATTMNTYSPTIDLNQFRYDEAGSLNEALSDFMSLIHLDDLESQHNLDNRIFSRWALGAIFSTNSERGAHQCPQYSAGWPTCSAFSQAKPFDGVANVVSYIYPDGMGWPYTSSTGTLSAIYTGFSSQEEIHNAAVLMEGALWDVYTVLKNAYGSAAAQSSMMSVVLNAMNPNVPAHPLQVPPQPPYSLNANLSPVTYPGYATAILDTCQSDPTCSHQMPGVTQALTARGLVGNKVPDANWIAVGDGLNGTPGMFILDQGGRLASWFSQISPDTSLQRLQQNGDGHLDAGEVAAIWFDIKNMSAITVGGPLVTVTSNNPHVTFLYDKYGNPINEGPISVSQAQVRYIKINGTNIVAALGFGGNSYFKSNPKFSEDWTTAIFIKVDPAAHGETASFTVQVQPSNGPVNTVTLTTKIN